MPTHATYVRQREVITITYLQRAGPPVPFAELQRYLLEQSPAGAFTAGYSERTFQRDLPLLAETFGYTIRARRGQSYYIADYQALLLGRQRLVVGDVVALPAFFRRPAALTPFVQPDFAAAARAAAAKSGLGPLRRNNGRSFYLHQHFGVNQGADLHHRRGRPDFAKYLAMSLTGRFPLRDIGHENAGAHHVG